MVVFIHHDGVGDTFNIKEFVFCFAADSSHLVSGADLACAPDDPFGVGVFACDFSELFDALTLKQSVLGLLKEFLVLSLRRLVHLTNPFAVWCGRFLQVL